MKALKRYKYHLVAVLILLGLLLLGVQTKMSPVTKSADELPQVGSAFQMNHALELNAAANVSYAIGLAGTDLRAHILNIVKQSVPAHYEDKAFEIARAVIVEANHHHMDPLFLLAVIATESKFNVDARGTHGEIGLMQVMPSTAKWLAPQAGLSHGFDLHDPAVNIRLGATYLARLRTTFKHKSTRYISAYNMGVKNVYRLLKARVEPKLYSGRVLANYNQIYLSVGNKIVNAIAARDIASMQ